VDDSTSAWEEADKVEKIAEDAEAKKQQLVMQ
jgi:hypothetical protein